MRTDIDAVEITIVEDGTATLTGLSYDDLRSLLTAASLHYGDHPAKAMPLDSDLDEAQHENNLTSFRWHLDRRLILDALTAKMDHAITPTYCTGDIALIKRLHGHEVTELEDTVQRAEAAAAAAKAGQAPDLVGDAAKAIAKAIREADAAMAQLNHALRQ